jgi:hypothetical protein
MNTADVVTRARTARVAVMGYVGRNGLAQAVAVTPYVVEDQLVMSSTLALIAKAEALRADPRVSLSVGGLSVTGVAEVVVDLTPTFFDRYLREQELEKFPLRGDFWRCPFTRTAFPWWVGRVIIRVVVESLTEQTESDRATVTYLDASGGLRTRNVAMPRSLSENPLVVPAGVDAEGTLLVIHEEDASMSDLRQVALRGTLREGLFTVNSRRGTLDSTKRSTLGEITYLRELAKKAKANRSALEQWPRYRHGDRAWSSSTLVG